MSKCCVCDQYNAVIYNDNTEDFYCMNCYKKYQEQINCECEGSCTKCEEGKYD